VIQEHHASEVRGAHEVIRHTSIRLFWGRAAGPHEELPWGKFWDLFPSTLHGADTTTLMRQSLAVIDNRYSLSGSFCYAVLLVALPSMIPNMIQVLLYPVSFDVTVLSTTR